MLPIKTATKAEPRPESHGTVSSKATAWWDEAKAEFESVFRQFAEAAAGEGTHTAADIEAYLEPLRKAAWKVSDKRIRESWKNALASAGVQRRRRQAGK